MTLFIVQYDTDSPFLVKANDAEHAKMVFVEDRKNEGWFDEEFMDEFFQEDLLSVQEVIFNKNGVALLETEED